jgi:hypothetical protein
MQISRRDNTNINSCPIDILHKICENLDRTDINNLADALNYYIGYGVGRQFNGYSYMSMCINSNYNHIFHQIHKYYHITSTQQYDHFMRELLSADYESRSKLKALFRFTCGIKIGDINLRSPIYMTQFDLLAEELEKLISPNVTPTIILCGNLQISAERINIDFGRCHLIFVNVVRFICEVELHAHFITVDSSTISAQSGGLYARELLMTTKSIINCYCEAKHMIIYGLFIESISITTMHMHMHIYDELTIIPINYNSLGYLPPDNTMLDIDENIYDAINNNMIGRIKIIGYTLINIILGGRFTTPIPNFDIPRILIEGCDRISCREYAHTRNVDYDVYYVNLPLGFKDKYPEFYYMYYVDDHPIRGLKEIYPADLDMFNVYCD